MTMKRLAAYAIAAAIAFSGTAALGAPAFRLKEKP
jgi:hypothetical protein